MYSYSLIQNVYNWGASFSRVIIKEPKVSKPEDYFVHVQKYDKFENLLEEGERKVVGVYKSDENGNRKEDGEYVTLELEIKGINSLASPFYDDPTIWNEGGHAYLKSWAKTNYTIRNCETDEVFDMLEHIYKPDEEKFLFGEYTLNDEVLPYAYYEPSKDDKKHPLIIWLHGYGSGGDELGFVTGGMLTTYFITKDVQDIFGGAHVMMPQAHTAWMDDGSGFYTKDGHSMYTKIVESCIQNYIDTHDDIDVSRIYIGGCSNGGYMTMNMLLENPNRYAAAFPVCEAYQDKWLRDEDIQILKNIPLWFVHAENDTLVDIYTTALATYERLKEVGHSDLHLSKYEKIIDPDLGFEYMGHFAWVYSLRNLCKEKEVTLYEWVASHHKS